MGEADIRKLARCNQILDKALNQCAQIDNLKFATVLAALDEAKVRVDQAMRLKKPLNMKIH